jgi:hypothetical protein
VDLVIDTDADFDGYADTNRYMDAVINIDPYKYRYDITECDSLGDHHNYRYDITDGNAD